MVIALRRCLFSLLLPADPRFLSLGEAQGGTGHRTNSGTAWRADGAAGCSSWLCAWAPIEVRSGLAGRTEPEKYLWTPKLLQIFSWTCLPALKRPRGFKLQILPCPLLGLCQGAEALSSRLCFNMSMRNCPFLPLTVISRAKRSLSPSSCGRHE